MDILSSLLNGVLIVVLLVAYCFSSNRDQHLAAVFVLSVYFVFFFLTPFINAINDETILFYNNLEDYITLVNIHYFIAIIFFAFGYHSFIYKSNKCKKKELVVNSKLAHKIIIYSFIFCLIMVLLWAYLSGFTVRSLFFMSTVYRNYSSFESSYNYLKLFSECFISIFFASIVFKMRFRYVLVMLVISVSIYLSFGFRFRVIVLILGAVIYYLHINKMTFRVLSKAFLVMLFMALIMIVQGWYKQTLRELSYSGESNIAVNVEDKRIVDSFVRYTRNHLAFASLIKYIDKSEGEYDYGSTIFLQPFIRMIPSALFPSGEKPEVQAIVTSSKSWGSVDGLYAGEAYCNIGEMYNAFGTAGVIVLSYFFGFIVRRISKLNKEDPWGLVLYISIVSSLFHYITRGYFPGYIMLVGYLILICLFMKNIYNRVNSNVNNIH